MEMKRVAVIGAGVSGLTVAKLLSPANEVTVYEAEDSIGGLVRCERIDGNLFHTCGGHIFNTKKTAVLDWFWQQFDREKEFRLAERNSVIFPIEGKSLNLLQAIARFGGTNGESMDIKDVAVIRTENGIRRAYSVNLQKKELFDSPVFYLQQNDVIYLKHRGSRMSSGVMNFISTIGIISSFASLVLSYLALTK